MVLEKKIKKEMWGKQNTGRGRGLGDFARDGQGSNRWEAKKDQIGGLGKLSHH